MGIGSTVLKPNGKLSQSVTIASDGTLHCQLGLATDGQSVHERERGIRHGLPLTQFLIATVYNSGFKTFGDQGTPWTSQNLKAFLYSLQK